jgi:hypothetical protein
MKIIAKQMGGGKTTELLKLSAKNKMPIISVGGREYIKKVLKAQAKRLNLDIPEPYSWYDIMRGKHRGKRYPGFLIDDIDVILGQFLSAPVHAASITTCRNLADYKAVEKYKEK